MNLSLVVVSLALLVQQATAPNFSGSWKMIADRSGSPTQTPPVNDMVFTIDQNAEQLRLDMSGTGSEPVSVTYPIVEAPKPPAEPLGAGQKRAYWNGKGLVVERGGTINGQTVSSKQTLTLNADGSEMTVERLVIVQHGYTLKGTPNYATVTDVFARAR